MTWFANMLIVIGLWRLGIKERSAFIFTFVGEVIWIVSALSSEQYDLAAICAVFALIAVRNFVLWK